MDIMEKSTLIVIKHFKKRFRGISSRDLALLRRILEHIVQNVEKINEPKKSEPKSEKNK